MKSYLASHRQAIPWPPQLREAGHSPWLPLTLLLLALSTVFIFTHDDRGTFYRTDVGDHDHLTARHLAVAANLSLEHRFLGFHYRALEPDGSLYYDTYNRFPIGGYLLIKLFILPFDDDLSAQIYSARILMLLAYAGAVVLAYWSLTRLTGQRWIALTAVLLAFAAPYWLYYNDAVTPEVGLDFFGVMLTFYGMVLFVQECRFRQLLLKSCLALLLGWHTYALLLPFILMGLANELIRAGTTASPSPPLTRIVAGLARLFRSRYLTLGILTLLFGTALLSFNLGNEYFHHRGEKSLTELPSVDSLNRRLSLSPVRDQVFANKYFTPDYLKEQFYHIGGMSTPHALPPGYLSELGLGQYYEGNLTWYGIILGGAVTAVALLGLAFVANKLLWAALSLCGFCWMLLVSGQRSLLEYEILFYTGIPLAAFSFLMLYFGRPGGHRFIAAGAGAALLVFGLSSYQISQSPPPPPTLDARTQQSALADLGTIRNLTQGHTVSYIGNLPEIYRPMQYYFSRVTWAPAALSDFIILPLRLDLPELLTPQNKRIFLYPGGPDAFPHYIDHILSRAGPPLVNADYAVYYYAGQLYRPDDWLFYVKKPCQIQDRPAHFFLHLVPQDPADLPPERWQYGFANLDFWFGSYAWFPQDMADLPPGRWKRRFTSRDFQFRNYGWPGWEVCIAGIPLPPYPIAQITTGQYDHNDGPLWQGKAALPPEKPPAQ